MHKGWGLGTKGQELGAHGYGSKLDGCGTRYRENLIRFYNL